MTNWIEYKEKKILFSDYSGLSSDDMVRQLEEETNIILESVEQKILYLASFDDIEFSPEFIKKGNELGKNTREKIHKSAFIGISGKKSFSLHSFNKITGINAKAFKNEIDAKEYLINE